MKTIKEFYHNKNVLVTGGAGFIGSHIAQTLCSYDANVTVIDDLSTGFLDNLAQCAHKITFIAGDITCLKACLKATKKQTIIFHAAAFVSVPESIKHPVLCEKINIEGTQNLLEAGKKNNVSTFIFSSSASVYGNKTDVCYETDEPNPESPYAQSKLAGEKLCQSYASSINCASLRYFNVYGERQNPHGSYAGVVAKFTYNLKNGHPITIYGDGKQKRDFIHVSKVVEANLLLATQPNLQGSVFNIATGKSITLLELLKNLEKEIKQETVSVSFKPSRKGDIFSSQASCKKYKTVARTFSN